MKKSVVSSFDVDHRTLKEGLYLRSVYEIDDRLAVRSWDLRFCEPMAHKPLCAGAVHTIEHLMAYYLRLDEKIGASIVSFCPMGLSDGILPIDDEQCRGGGRQGGSDTLYTKKYSLSKVPTI